MNIIDVLDYAKTDIFNMDKIVAELDPLSDIEQVQYIALLKERATELKCRKAFDTYLQQLVKRGVVILPRDDDDEDDEKPTFFNEIDSYLKIMQTDPFFAKVKFNLFQNRAETEEDGKVRMWSNADDAKAQCYIEKKYNIFSEKKYISAFEILCSERAYHPVRDMIDKIKWDGVPRIEECLIKWLGADDTPYSRECSRLLFAGGINRIYKPGCKFDSVVVLVGKQGCGKSSFISWLAMNPSFFNEITTFEGKDGMEILNGTWIGELGELLALCRAKERESIKSYITRQVDYYRQAYDRRAEEHPREVIFIGSTNNNQFLSDKTGERRFLPVECKCDGRELYQHEAECKQYIAQCWAEAKAKMGTEAMSVIAKASVLEAIAQAQQEATEDDYREGLISAYLEDKNITCILDLWENALHEDLRKPTKKDSNEIAAIVRNIQCWERCNGGRDCGKYKKQKCWQKKRLIPVDDATPF